MSFHTISILTQGMCRTPGYYICTELSVVLDVSYSQAVAGYGKEQGGKFFFSLRPDFQRYVSFDALQKCIYAVFLRLAPIFPRLCPLSIINSKTIIGWQITDVSATLHLNIQAPMLYVTNLRSPTLYVISTDLNELLARGRQAIKYLMQP